MDGTTTRTSGGNTLSSRRTAPLKPKSGLSGPPVHNARNGMNTEDNGTARVRVCTYLHASHTISASLFVLILHGDSARFGFALRQILVQAIANFSILLRLLPQPVRVFGLTLEQHLEARLLLQIIPDFARGGAGIEGQWIFT